MRNKRKLALAFLVIVLITGAAWLLVRSPREPSYQGKSLTQWLNEYNRAGSMDKTGPISDAIRAMGTNSLPFLLAYINHPDSKLKFKLQKLLRKQHLIKPSILGSDYRSVSILALSALGTNAAPLFPDLLKLADDPQIHWWGAMSLLAIGPSSIPTLEKVCESTNVQVRTDAVLMMAMLKTMGAPWFSWGWNKGADGQLEFGLGYAVGDNAVQEMINMMRDSPNPAVRRASADALALYTYGPYTSVAKSAIPPLTKALTDPDPAIRQSAANTLKKIDPDAAAKAGIK